MPEQKLPMDISRARTIVLGEEKRGLGRPLKMPWYAFGLPASACARGKELAKDPRSVCAHCYGWKAFYLTYRNVHEAHALRMAGLKHPDWVLAMTALLIFYAGKGRSQKPKYFRWFDCGDLQGVWLLANIVDVCRQTPMVRHWLPTHEPYIVKEYLALAKIGKLPPIPKNLCIRISADFVGKPSQPIDGLEQIPTHTVHRGHGTGTAVQVSDDPRDTFECPSFRHANKRNDAGQCMDCRMCWNAKKKNVSFPLHGENAELFQLRLNI